MAETEEQTTPNLDYLEENWVERFFTKLGWGTDYESHKNFFPSLYVIESGENHLNLHYRNPGEGERLFFKFEIFTKE